MTLTCGHNSLTRSTSLPRAMAWNFTPFALCPTPCRRFSVYVPIPPTSHRASIATVFVISCNSPTVSPSYPLPLYSGNNGIVQLCRVRGTARHQHTKRAEHSRLPDDNRARHPNRTEPAPHQKVEPHRG